MRKKLLNLKIELVKRSLSQAALARAIGRSPSQVSRMIRGISRPRLLDKERISEFLGLKQSQLFRSHRRRKVEASLETRVVPSEKAHHDHNSMSEESR